MNVMIKEHPPVLVAEEGLTLPPHAHHWMIAEAEGPTSQGICAFCGAVRMFKNWDSAHDYVLNTEAKIGC